MEKDTNDDNGFTSTLAVFFLMFLCLGVFYCYFAAHVL